MIVVRPFLCAVRRSARLLVFPQAARVYVFPSADLAL